MSRTGLKNKKNIKVNRGTWRNTDTGELKDIEQIAMDLRVVSNGKGEIVNTYNQSELEVATLNKMNGYAIHKRKKEVENIIKDNFGNYIHYIYVKTPTEMDKKFKVYMIKMATNLNYNDKYIYLGNKNDPNRIIVKKDKDLMKVLDITGKRTYTDIRNALLDSKVLGKDDIGYFINPKMAVNGDVKTKGGYIRVMINGFNELYASDKIALGYFIDLIPYINKEHNVICHNPDEKNIERVVPMTISEIADVVNVPQKNSVRLKNKLIKLSLDNKDVFAMISRQTINFFIINPSLLYGGSGKHIEGIKNIFKIE